MIWRESAEVQIKLQSRTLGMLWGAGRLHSPVWRGFWKRWGLLCYCRLFNSHWSNQPWLWARRHCDLAAVAHANLWEGSRSKKLISKLFFLWSELGQTGKLNPETNPSNKSQDSRFEIPAPDEHSGFLLSCSPLASWIREDLGAVAEIPKAAYEGEGLALDYYASFDATWNQPW